MLTCFSKQYFGIECPGCGIQRSFIALLHGNIMDSLALYPGLLPIGFFILVSILSATKLYEIKGRWIVVLAVFSMAIILGHYILKILGLAPWYDEAAAHFH